MNQGDVSVGHGVGLWIYFESGAGRICCWIGCGVGEKEVKINFKVFGLNNWRDKIAIYSSGDGGGADFK